MKHTKTEIAEVIYHSTREKSNFNMFPFPSPLVDADDTQQPIPSVTSHDIQTIQYRL